ILDSATGTFYDEFQKRAQPFVEVVKQAQSKSEGTIAEAGLESESDNGAQVLVAVTVKTSNAGAPDQAPRAWRMRISVQKVGDDAKVSNVDFVPGASTAKTRQQKRRPCRRTPRPSISRMRFPTRPKRPTSQPKPPTRQPRPLNRRSPSGRSSGRGCSPTVCCPRWRCCWRW